MSVPTLEQEESTMSQHTSDIPLDTHGSVGIDSSAQSQAMLAEFLTSKAYSRPMEAVIREYAANARDAQIEAGVSLSEHPVHVYLPNHENNFTFKVSDAGTGMSTSECISTFGTLLSSNKRQRNDVTGHFGAGSKSGYSVADQITVDTVKNGTQSIIVFSPTGENARSYDVLYTGPTDQPSGTTISFVINEDNQGEAYAWRRAAVRALEWWSEGEVTVHDMVHDVTYDDDNNRITNDIIDIAVYHRARNQINDNPRIWYSKSGSAYSESNNKVIILMAGITYPMNDELQQYFQDQLNFNVYKNHNGHRTFYIEVENKSVDPMLSRETLIFNAKTTQALINALDTLVATIREHDADLLKQLNDANIEDARAFDFGQFITNPFTTSSFYHGENMAEINGGLGHLASNYSARTASNINAAAHHYDKKAHFIEPHQMVITHVDAETTLDEIRPYLRSYLIHHPTGQQLREDVANIQRGRPPAYYAEHNTIVRLGDAIGWERTHPAGIHIVTFDELITYAKKAERETRAERARIKKAEREAWLAEHPEEAEAAGVTPKKPTAKKSKIPTWNVTHDLKGDYEQMPRDQVNNKDYPIIYVVGEDHCFDSTRLMAMPEYRLIIHNRYPSRVRKALYEAGVKYHEILSYEAGELEKKYIDPEILKFIHPNELTQLIHTIKTLASITNSEYHPERRLKNKRAQAFLDYANGNDSFTGGYSYGRITRHMKSPIALWLMDHPLIYDKERIYLPQSDESQDEFIEYMNRKKIKLPPLNKVPRRRTKKATATPITTE